MISNEMDRLYTENGGLNMNGSTGQDLTTFQVSLPANKLELWARIESDRMMNPVLREFFTERDVIMEEKRQRTESNPDGKLWNNSMPRPSPCIPTAGRSSAGAPTFPFSAWTTWRPLSRGSTLRKARS